MNAGRYAAMASKMHDRLLRGIWFPPPPHKRERPPAADRGAHLEILRNNTSAINSPEAARTPLLMCGRDMRVASISAPDRQLLAKLLSILGSDQPGERDAAGLAAHRLVTASGLTWAHVVCTAQDAPQASSDPLGRDWRMTAVRAQSFQYLINRWDSKLLGDIPSCTIISAKQRTTLIAIVVRLRASGCAL